MLYRDDGHVLLALRSGTRWADGYWSVPAGHLKGGETLPEAAVREAREELGIGIDPDDLAHVVTVDYREGTEIRALTAFFTARHWTGAPDNLEPDLCRRLAWFPRTAFRSRSPRSAPPPSRPGPTAGPSRPAGSTARWHPSDPPGHLSPALPRTAAPPRHASARPSPRTHRCPCRRSCTGHEEPR
ncbi:NUDIX domain-containing protein [Kitasatospora paranensis]|uniref:NUDIX domain-containing protein n=1 Tax=Kitasatospora paranensis TaxID=258053 RepID=UPI003CD0AEE5